MADATITHQRPFFHELLQTGRTVSGEPTKLYFSMAEACSFSAASNRHFSNEDF